MNMHIMKTGMRHQDNADCNEFTPALSWLAAHRAPRWLGRAWLAVAAALTAAFVWAGLWAGVFRAGPDAPAAGTGGAAPAGIIIAGLVLALLCVASVAALGRRWGPGAVVTVTVNGGVVVGAGAGSWWAGLGVAAACLGAGLITWLAQYVLALVRELLATRERLAETAVAEERLRFSRDMHDLLGHTLSIIVVKSELVRRLAPIDPAAAASHAADVQAIGRQALAEVREAVTGYRSQGLAAELENARMALDAADVSVSVSDGTLPQDLDDAGEAVLAWVVREGTTNVIRHASAGHCRISVFRTGESVRLDVVDDGLAGMNGGTSHGASGGGTSAPFPNGSGLRGLRERVAGVGGEFSAGATASGFTLSAAVPAAGSPSSVPAQHAQPMAT